MSTIGVMLVVLGAVLMAAEAHVASHGVLGVSAAAALALGIALALSGAGAPAGAVIGAGAAVGAGATGLAWLLLVKSLATRRIAERSGPRALLGRVATVRTVPAPVGQVALDGTLWRCRLWADEETTPAEGSPVVVEAIDGLTLTVRPAEEWEVV